MEGFSSLHEPGNKISLALGAETEKHKLHFSSPLPFILGEELSLTTICRIRPFLLVFQEGEVGFFGGFFSAYCCGLVSKGHEPLLKHCPPVVGSTPRSVRACQRGADDGQVPQHWLQLQPHIRRFKNKQTKTTC